MPFHHAAMHITCVATRLEGGQANNALPARARAIVNCRTAPPALRPEVGASLEQLVGETWPHLKVVPSMAVGASDSTYTNAAGLRT